MEAGPCSKGLYPYWHSKSIFLKFEMSHVIPQKQLESRVPSEYAKFCSFPQSRLPLADFIRYLAAAPPVTGLSATHGLWSPPGLLPFWILRRKLPSQTSASCAGAHRPVRSFAHICVLLPSLASLGCSFPSSSQRLGSSALQHPCPAQFTPPASLVPTAGTAECPKVTKGSQCAGWSHSTHSWGLSAAGKFLPCLSGGPFSPSMTLF